MTKRLIFFVLLLLAPTGALRAQGSDHAGHAGGPTACTETTLVCAHAATPFVAADGKLWLVWGAGGIVSVAQSTDQGRQFSAPVAVSAEPATLDTGPDARPQILVQPDGRIVVAYAIFQGEAFNGRVLTATSTDGGKSFSRLNRISSSEASQRFVVLGQGGDGHIFASWIDKRLIAAAAKQGTKLPGGSVVYAWSDDGGAHFSDAAFVARTTCECCRLGLALPTGGQPVLLFRNLFEGGVRDHAVVGFAAPDQPGQVQRVAVDDWAISVCPHHGPSLAVAPDGSYHAAWFTNGKIRQGIFYAHTTDGGRNFSAPMTIGDPKKRPARPYLLAIHNAVWLAWKELENGETHVLAMVSRDGGNDWSTPRIVARTKGVSDHPLLISNRGQATLSWLSRDDGYYFIALEDRS